MTEKLIQLRIDSKTKQKTDDLLKTRGLTTPLAIKMILIQMANTGITPFDNLFQTKRVANLKETIEKTGDEQNHD